MIGGAQREVRECWEEPCVPDKRECNASYDLVLLGVVRGGVSEKNASSLTSYVRPWRV